MTSHIYGPSEARHTGGSHWSGLTVTDYDVHAVMMIMTEDLLI